MYSIKKLIIVAGLMASTEFAFAQISIGPEVTPPENFGALAVEDLGPVFAHPLAEDAPPHPAPAPVPPKVAEKQSQKNDIMSLFQNENPKAEEKNPLEEEAKNEMKALEDPEGPKLPEQMMQLGENNSKQNEMKGLDNPQGQKLPEQMMQLGENDSKQNEMKGLEDPEGPKLPEQMVQLGENSSKQPELTIKAENAPKEIELDNANDSKSLPTILR